MPALIWWRRLTSASKRTGLFGANHHADDHRVEHARVLGHRRGRLHAGSDVVLDREDQLAEVGVLLLLAERDQAARQRDARIYHRGELAEEDGQLLQLDALEEPAAKAGAVNAGLGILLDQVEHEQALVAQRVERIHAAFRRQRTSGHTTTCGPHTVAKVRHRLAPKF
jgi:hypothetical protein